MDCNIAEVNGKGINAFIERCTPLIVNQRREVNNLTFELHLSIDSQYSLPVEALNLIVSLNLCPLR